MKYIFTCPLDGCDHTVMTVESNTKDDAIDMLTTQAKTHLHEVHPTVHKTDVEIHDDIAGGITTVTEDTIVNT